MNGRYAHLVDTSILLCLLKVPDACERSWSEVRAELERIINQNETLILPIASILEAGNHIAKIRDGNIKRTIAIQFAGYLTDTAENRAPWKLMNMEWSGDDLRKFAAEFPDQAQNNIAFGDMSIINAFID